MGDWSRTEAAHICPGQYKYDADVSLCHRETVPKGALTDAARPSKWSFPQDSRTNKHGALKAVMNPDNKWIAKAGPGDYEEVDRTDNPSRVSWPSVPAWSVPKEAGREKQPKRITGAGPGSYELPSLFDHSRTKRLAAERRLLRRELSRS